MESVIQSNELSIHEKIIDKLDYFYKTNKIPHIIFHGPSGSGKRTVVDKFLNQIYQNDHKRIKTNVMMVNCAHGKGIKFIREELKFFAKTNIQSNAGVLFKTIVLLNADNLTIDAQSALRRCIELFSYNTRFFIIIENKTKLLNPILSRFCEIYVPENIVNGKVLNLHRNKIDNVYDFSTIESDNKAWVIEKMDHFFIKKPIDYVTMVDISTIFYEQGLSCFDILTWVEQTDHILEIDKTEIYMHFDTVKAEYRCEKLLMFYLFDFIAKRLCMKKK
uniref:AAA+ ATPase domain-containing protein n=1 Tax=viral metagenome TaxID=1070528 RepID=A0A6C0DV34_9ZZZZ